MTASRTSSNPVYNPYLPGDQQQVPAASASIMYPGNSPVPRGAPSATSPRTTANNTVPRPLNGSSAESGSNSPRPRVARKQVVPSSGIVRPPLSAYSGHGHDLLQQQQLSSPKATSTPQTIHSSPPSSSRYQQQHQKSNSASSASSTSSSSSTNSPSSRANGSSSHLHPHIPLADTKPPPRRQYTNDTNAARLQSAATTDDILSGATGVLARPADAVGVAASNTTRERGHHRSSDSNGGSGSGIDRYRNRQSVASAGSSVSVAESIGSATNGGRSSGGANSQELTVQKFEASKRKARARPADSAAQLDYARNLVEACGTLAGQYADSETVAGGTRRPPDVATERKTREIWTTRAHKIVKKLASHGDPGAMFFLAASYGSGGLGLEVDYEKAYELYYKAAHKYQHAESAYRVAVCNEIGAGTRRDPAKAMFWYRRAAQLGDVSAMYKLGMIALNGTLDQEQSFAEGVTWLQRAAELANAQNPHAVHELGLLYEHAHTYPGNVQQDSTVGPDGNKRLRPIVECDERRAFELFMRAAKLGYPPSQFRLGCCYEYGALGCAIDPRRSIAWYFRAAEKGESESELALSGWYLTGSSRGGSTTKAAGSGTNALMAPGAGAELALEDEVVIEQSDTEAYLWARRAAEKGLSKAEYALGYYTEVGIGVRPDMEEAKRWYLKAAAQRHPKALARLQELRQEQMHLR